MQRTANAYNPQGLSGFDSHTFRQKLVRFESLTLRQVTENNG